MPLGQTMDVSPITGFIQVRENLENLGNLEKGPILKKSGKSPGKSQKCKKSGKVRGNTMFFHELLQSCAFEKCFQKGKCALSPQQEI